MNKLIDKLWGAWRSKTIQFNALALAILALSDQLLLLMPQLQVLLAPGHYDRFVAVVTIGNAMLRFVTRSALEHK
jgi:hypothetical protein